MGHVQVSRLIQAPALALFDFLAQPENATASVASVLRIEFAAAPKSFEPGTEFEAAITRYSLTTRTVFRIEEMAPPHRVSYRQIAGLLRSWEHTQIIEKHDGDSALLTDVVDFRLPFGILGSLFDDLFFRGDVIRALRSRQAWIAAQMAGPTVPK
jgi:ligand-binding SRPBCC domain-containing protein